MRKKKSARSNPNNFNSASSSLPEEDEESLQIQLQQNNNNENEISEGEGFFACYLLASLNPRFKGHTYIGFTVNPRRRIRQHNGEIGSGAWRTKKKRPWEMVLCIYGFPTNVAALQFEWAWQHPVESLAVRKAAVEFKSLSGIANKIKLAYTMLTLPSWQNMNMTVNFFSTKYMKHCAGCPNLPEHMTVEIGLMDELPCYTERIDGLVENEDDITDEVEFDDNNASTSGSVPDASDDSVTDDSQKSPNHSDKITEPLGQNKESEVREPQNHSFTRQEQSELFGSISSPKGNKESEVREPPSHLFTLQEQSQPFGLILSPEGKSSLATSSKRGVIEDTDFLSSAIKSSVGSYNSEQTGVIGVRGASFAPHQAEIIDLSTPSPSCRSVIDRKKRKVSSSVSSEFIDLTKSPNFIQL
ncbi:putative GIY-YIG nuclease superfamily, structure-specific endonuclease subunit Slx1 [Medicago truncatula]|uniref:Structure-specific endonuclease subunit SLX1 homolog n=1 Tax=Medicago truncatula TaxID=3880 RepID=A0A072UYE2_MEDTR|nr:structure-specific endonuclease subunit SLX1 homolog [Medicago truncatula]KEH34436.1 endo/excinuclease amino terminal domain protein [Medicago truncatula]RHN67834.1 putative GIY-YIG nuclease superfamily, structure-specific endonuclease subunit Slx1 [Medicago truncatula]